MLLTKKRKSKLFKFLGSTKLSYMPFILNLEPGNVCNLKCPLCPTGQQDSEMQKGFLELGLFKEIVSQLKTSVDTLNFYSWGEPLLNRDFIPMLRYCKEINPRIKIITSTNLNTDNKALLADLILSDIDEIIVSCDGATQDSYLKYRSGGDFNLVIDNLKYMQKQKAEHNKNTNIIWNFLVFSHNECEVQKAKAMAREIGVSFRIGLMRTSMKDEILIPHEEAIKKDKNWIPDNPQYSAYDKENNAPRKIITTCRKPWQEISINWDGKVFACCAIYGDKYNYGNVKEEGIQKIWNNLRYRMARSEILNQKIKATTVCGRCRDNGFMHM